MRKGELVVLSGFSGSGKGTIVSRLLEKYDTYVVSVSVTTRQPRPGEKEGVSYFYRSREEFDRMAAEDGFLEYATYVDHSYGTPRFYVEEQREKGKDVILEIEIQGALQIKKAYPEAVLIFVTPPSASELEKRLVGRSTETMDVIRSRMERAREEAEGMDLYDFLLINDELESCVEDLHGIIRAQHFLASRQRELIETVKTELKEREEA